VTSNPLRDASLSPRSDQLKQSVATLRPAATCRDLPQNSACADARLKCDATRSRADLETTESRAEHAYRDIRRAVVPLVS
jgi:hypothetical protein